MHEGEGNHRRESLSYGPCSADAVSARPGSTAMSKKYCSSVTCSRTAHELSILTGKIIANSLLFHLCLTSTPGMHTSRNSCSRVPPASLSDPSALCFCPLPFASPSHPATSTFAAGRLPGAPDLSPHSTLVPRISSAPNDPICSKKRKSQAISAFQQRVRAHTAKEGRNGL